MNPYSMYSWMRTFSMLMVMSMFLPGCGPKNISESTTNELYEIFQDPPSDYRPFMRWWWNGNCIEVDRLRQELDIMKAAGIGGVEINPIAHPGDGEPFDYQCYEWASSEWNDRVKATIDMARERNMIVDIIMGSGWPFGGEFLREDQFLQGVGVNKLEFTGPNTVTLNVKEEWRKPGRDFGIYTNPDAPEPELFFMRMIPQGASGIAEVTDLMANVDSSGNITFLVPEGKHDIYIGTYQKAYRTVMHGAPGSRGPVVDHYNAADVRDYMDKLAVALGQVLSGELGDHIRSLFCDSIELSGANITDDYFEEFFKRRGYRLEPYLHFVYYAPYEGYTDTLSYNESFNEDIRRIRYDFNKTLVELFLERFTTTFNDWANEHGMKGRYQAYGQPWLMGMLDGYRLVDIPESNNWLYSRNEKAHGFWIWNKYCASGAYLSGAKVVSSEAMTNTSGVFRMTLNMVKKNDDFNFISGINHSVLHGFNYSPQEAGFPGWVRYGAYFSEQNTWWPYFRNWTDYNARLSAVFQESEPVVDVAILTPEADIWSQWGLFRVPFYQNPWYNHDLWEGFSRMGITANYINEGVIQRATAKDGNMHSENANFKFIIVSGAKSIEPETARAIQTLAEQGVSFLFIDRMPSKAPTYFEKEINDEKVTQLMQSVAQLNNVHMIPAPENESAVTAWTQMVAKTYNIKSNIQIEPVQENLYVLKHQYNGHEIFFFSNQDEQNTISFSAIMAQMGQTAWRWDPETGERHILPEQKNGKISANLKPLESLLIVLEDKKVKGDIYELENPAESSGLDVGDNWRIVFEPVKGTTFEVTSNKLFDFAESNDPNISTFAGKVYYHNRFSLDETGWDFIDLGVDVHVSELLLNGQHLGTSWYGRHLYRIPKDILKEGTNELEIIYTTTLANYANSLIDNAAAKRWIRLPKGDPMGLTNKVRLLKKANSK